MADISAKDFLRLAVSARPTGVERRRQLAELLMAEGKRAEAVLLLREGMVFAFGREDWLVELTDAFIAVDALPEALEALQAASRLCPGDGALRARLQDLSLQLKDGQMATRQLFNQYAADFEHDLESLHYTVPQQIAEMLLPYVGRFEGGTVIDLGCGTGLMGHYLRTASRLIGIDLSPAMLEQARAKNIYDELIEGDVVTSCLSCQKKVALVTAADVLVYIGDLQPLFTAVSSVLGTGGLFAFTVEKAKGNGFMPNKTKRFSHSESYIRAIAETAGFTVPICRDIVPRHDRGAPVDGLMVLLTTLL